MSTAESVTPRRIGWPKPGEAWPNWAAIIFVVVAYFFVHILAIFVQEFLFAIVTSASYPANAVPVRIAIPAIILARPLLVWLVLIPIFWSKREASDGYVPPLFAIGAVVVATLLLPWFVEIIVWLNAGWMLTRPGYRKGLQLRPRQVTPPADG